VPKLRSRRTLLLLGWMVVLAAGCARVEPSGDYRAAVRCISQRVGVDQVYDPAADELTDAKVTELLDGGLTVDEAVRVALLRNRGFQSLFLSIGASRADVVQSRLLTNPSLGFSARFPEGGGRSNLTLSFAQELLDLWQIPVRARIAEEQLRQTVLEVAREAIALATDVRIKCYEFIALERAEQIATENVQLVEQSLALAQARLRAGEAGQLDVNLLRASLLDVQTNLIGISRDRTVARAALGRLLGLSRWPQPWRLNDALNAPEGDIPPDGDLLLLAMRERLDAQVTASKVKAAEAELRRQYLSVFPSLSVGLEGERLERRALPGRKVFANTARASVRQGQLTAPDIQTRGERNAERSQIIDTLLGPTLQVTLPIWDQNQAQIAKAGFKAQQTRKEYEDVLDGVAQEVEQAAVIARAAAALTDFYNRQGLPQAQENLDIARQAYEAGEQGIVTLIEAQEFLIRQRLAASNVVRDYRIALAELERAVGGRLSAAAATQPAASQPVKEEGGGSP
jgi:cobalt-zinc-cadmium efflux system outer membrane protein